MKWNNEVRNKKKGDGSRIYDYCKARDSYNNKKFNVRQLSLMKQENIRMAILDNTTTTKDLLSVSGNQCGYCFKYSNYLDVDCKGCPLNTKMGRKCVKVKGYKEMEEATTKEEFAKNHEAWCKKLGLWRKGWK